MPRYEYVCGLNPEHRMDQVRSIQDRDAPITCPVCDAVPHPEKPGGANGMLQRDVIGSMPVHTTEKEYDRPLYSEALGIHPSQISEAQQKFPHHEFTPDGRMILRSHTQRERTLKELGFHDNN